MEQDRQGCDPAQALHVADALPIRVGDQPGHVAEVGRYAEADRDHVHGNEQQENRQQKYHRLPYPTQVQENQRQDEEHFGNDLVGLEPARQKTEQRVRAAGDRDRNGQHVIDHQRRTGEQAGLGPQKLGRDQITAAASGEQLDDLRIACRNDKDRHGHQHRERKGKIEMFTEREKGFFGTVGRRTQAVRAEPDPGEKGDQRNLMEDVGIERIFRLAEEPFSDGGPGKSRHNFGQ